MFTILIVLILAFLFSLKSQKDSMQLDKYYLVKSRCDILKAILPFAIVLAHLSFLRIIQLYRILGIRDLMWWVCSFLLAVMA